jgi:hemerythrin-like domain-containing protein
LLTRIGQGLPLENDAEFGKAVGLFLDLCNFHIEEEESMIYPEAKAQLSRVYGSSDRPIPRPAQSN